MVRTKWTLELFYIEATFTVAFVQFIRAAFPTGLRSPQRLGIPCLISCVYVYFLLSAHKYSTAWSFVGMGELPDIGGGSWDGGCRVVVGGWVGGGPTCCTSSVTLAQTDAAASSPFDPLKCCTQQKCSDSFAQLLHISAYLSPRFSPWQPPMYQCQLRRRQRAKEQNSANGMAHGSVQGGNLMRLPRLHGGAERPKAEQIESCGSPGINWRAVSSCHSGSLSRAGFSWSLICLLKDYCRAGVVWFSWYC